MVVLRILVFMVLFFRAAEKWQKWKKISLNKKKTIAIFILLLSNTFAIIFYVEENLPKQPIAASETHPNCQIWQQLVC